MQHERRRENRVKALGSFGPVGSLSPASQWPGVGLAPDGTLAYEYKYGRSPNQVGREDTVNVPMTADKLPGATAGLVRDKLPLTWRSLQGAR